MSTVKPILKWVGGKTQLLDKIEPYIPIIIQDYHEIFVVVIVICE